MVLKPMATDAKEPTFSMGDDIAVRGRRRPGPDRCSTTSSSASPRSRTRRSTTSASGWSCRCARASGRAARCSPRSPAPPACSSCPTFFLYPEAVDVAARLRPLRRSRRSVSTRHVPGRRRAGRARARDPRRWPTPPSRPSRAAPGVLVISDRRRRRRPRADPVAPRAGRGAPPARRRAHPPAARRSSSTRGDARDTHGVAVPARVTAPTPSARASRSRRSRAMADDGQLGELHSSEAQAKLQAALEDGVLKIFSKMGISTVDGYRGRPDLRGPRARPRGRRACLRGTTSRSAASASTRSAPTSSHATQPAFAGDEASLDEPGFFRFRKRGGEYHGEQPRGRRRAARRRSGSRPRATTRTATASAKKKSEVSGQARRRRRRRRARTRARSSSSRAARAPTPLPDARTRPTCVRAHLLQRAIDGGRADLTRRSASSSSDDPTTELHDLLELVPAASRSRSRRSSRSSAITRAVLDRRHVATARCRRRRTRRSRSR